MSFAIDGKISSWEELIAKQSTYDRSSQEWVFRGQSKDWPLATSLDLTCKNFDTRGPATIVLEQQIIRDFQRQYGKHAPGSSPRDDDAQQWLSLMRHYGAPTRLLDFTYSFFIAAYFALEEAEEDSFVWAINTNWLMKQAWPVIRKMGGSRLLNAWENRKEGAFKKIFFRRNRVKFVCTSNPYCLHERLVQQQALSLCPGDVTSNFEDNLREMAGYDNRDNVSKIPIRGGNCRKAILYKLYRAGVNRAVLFPGLEGFAKSLRYKTPIYLDIQKLTKDKVSAWPQRKGGRNSPPFPDLG